MKTIQKRWLSLFLLAAVTFLFPACEGNNPSFERGDDTSGLITVKLRNYSNGYITVDLSGGDRFFYIDGANNFRGSNEYVKFCDMGEKKLSTIKTIPTSGWAPFVAVLPNHSYLIRDIYYEWNTNLQEYEEKVSYYKLYVVDYITNTSGGIIGAEVKYCEWDPQE